MTSYNSLDTSLLNKRQAPTFMPHNMAQNYHQNQAMNFPYNNFAMQQYHAGYFREEQNKAYNTTTTQDPDEFLSEPTKKIKSEKNSEYSYPNGNPTFPYSQINNSQVSNQNNQLKATMQNMMYQNQNFQDHLASTNHKTWENASSGINTADQKTMAVEKPAPKPETNPAENPMAAFQQNSMMQNQYAQAMMAKYYSSMQNSAQAAQYKLYMQQQQQKFMNSNPYMNMTQAQAQFYWAQQMKNMNAQRQQAYQNMTAAAGNTGNTTENNTNNNPALAQSQAQAQAQAINNNSIMQFLKDQNKSQEVETKPQPQVQPQAQAQAQMQALLRNTNMADLAAKGIHININTASSKSEKQSNKIAPEEPEYNKTSKNHSTDFPSEEDKTTMISPTSFQVQDTNKIEGTAPAPIFDDIYFDINMANLDKFFDADGLGDFNNNVQDTAKKDDDKQVATIPVKKGRGRPKKEDQSQESKNNNKESKKEVKDVQEKKTNKKKAKEEKKEEEQAFTVADSFFNQANQMPFKQAGGAQGFLENQFEMASFPTISSGPKVPQKDSKEKISLPENNNSMNSLVKEQPEFTNSNSISMMYPGGYQQQQQPNDLFENFEFDFQDAEDFNFDEGTFLFEPFDESRQGEEFESTTEATGQPVRKRGRPRKYAPDGSLLIPDGSGQVRPPINKKASRLQAEREAYEKYLEELKKPYVIHIHHDDHDPEQKVNLTRVGEDHQLYVPPFGGGQAPAKKKSLSPLWAPDMATQEFLDSYLRRLEAVVGQKIAHQGAALRVLKIYNMRVDDVLENVKISPKYYQNYFKVNQRSAKNRFAH